MAGVCRITVEISRRSYNIIRQRASSTEHKTSRILARYLGTYFTCLAEGEQTLFKQFNAPEARRLAEILCLAQEADCVPWDEFSTFSAARVASVILVHAPTEIVLSERVARLSAFEILALMEYAQLDEDAFERQTARFRG